MFERKHLDATLSSRASEQHWHPSLLQPYPVSLTRHESAPRSDAEWAQFAPHHAPKQPALQTLRLPAIDSQIGSAWQLLAADQSREAHWQHELSS